MVGKTNSKTNKKPVTKTVNKTGAKKKSTSVDKAKQIPTWKKALTMIACILIPMCVGFVSAGITGDAMKKFGQFNQPPFAPPAWLFPVAWTILYALMGVALYFIIMLKSNDDKERKFWITAIILFFVQLALNFVWSPIFFLNNDFFLALIVLIVMWVATIIMMCLIRERSMPAMWCLLPYVLWCLFAMYLNVGIALLN